jgi:hypothetical protein
VLVGVVLRRELLGGLLPLRLGLLVDRRLLVVVGGPVVALLVVSLLVVSPRAVVLLGHLVGR